MSVLTIFTPTFNRKAKLSELYDSLLRQTNQQFQWLIVDDGSGDGTGNLVQKWISERNIQIRYVYQENGGKMRAMARGIALCETPWMICVDSDDRLSENAVEIMMRNLYSANGDSNAGFVYPQRLNGITAPKWLPDDVCSINIMDLKHLYGIAESAILFRTSYLKQVEIPSFEKENFLSEEVVYNRLAEFGSFTPINERFYISEYQGDGVTSNLFQLWLKNPKGTLCLLQNRFAYCGRYPMLPRVKNRIKCIMNLNAFCISCGLSVLKETPSSLYSILLFFPSLLWKRIRFKG